MKEMIDIETNILVTEIMRETILEEIIEITKTIDLFEYKYMNI